MAFGVRDMGALRGRKRRDFGRSGFADDIGSEVGTGLEDWATDSGMLMSGVCC